MQNSEQSMGKIPRSRSRVLGQFLEKVRPGNVTTQDRERSKSAGQMEKPAIPSSTPQKPKKLNAQQLNMEKLESHIKEKIQDIVYRRQSSRQNTAQAQTVVHSKSDTETERKLSKDDRKLSKSDLEQIAKLGARQRIMYKKIGKSCDKINTCSIAKLEMEPKKSRSDSMYQRIPDGSNQNVKALVHTDSRNSMSPKCTKAKGKTTPKQRKPKVLTILTRLDFY